MSTDVTSFEVRVEGLFASSSGEVVPTQLGLPAERDSTPSLCHTARHSGQTGQREPQTLEERKPRLRSGTVSRRTTGKSTASLLFRTPGSPSELEERHEPFWRPWMPGCWGCLSSPMTSRAMGSGSHILYIPSRIYPRMLLVGVLPTV